ncbi:LppU/SCO3897 family protein [Streptomyces regalis]|uniref:Uncharacterized protein n=1 Tax=Streptomyces regalis TaxID=68262 RepID=A0A124G8U5_9ACTN|nr:hypothetical protein [Streptomyces regalis]KUL26981.1 hypothetical protein ADL12_31235 [Streptomyces regalis]
MTTPPPQGNPFAQGQNPYAQGQQPYGQPQGQAPYPPQGGYPQQPGQPGFPQQGAAPYAPVPPQQPKRGIKQYLRIGLIVVGLLFAAGGYMASRDDAETAAVGDCMHRGSTSSTRPDLEVVDCSSSEAQYVVLAKIEGSYTTELAASSKCESEAKDFEYTYSQSSKSSDFLLCLKEYKK